MEACYFDCFSLRQRFHVLSFVDDFVDFFAIEARMGAFQCVHAFMSGCTSLFCGRCNLAR